MEKCLGLLVVLACAACEKSSSNNDDAHQKFFSTLKTEEFCLNYGFLGLTDEGVKSDLALLCSDNQPTELFSELIKNAYRGPGPLANFTYSQQSEVENERSSFLVGFATKIPKLNAVQIRESGLNEFLIRQVENDVYKLVTALVSDASGDGLNYSKRIIKYETIVKGPQSTEFKNTRLMEMNGYQVTANCDDLALVTEHLMENETNNDYDWARSSVVIVGDPRDGGCFLISLVNYRTWNQGFHKINMSALETITKENALAVFDFLGTKASLLP